MLRQVFLAGLILANVVCAQVSGPWKLASVRKIWDQAPHNAFTDLIRYKDKWYCVFREGSAHVPGVDGTIRVLTSDDGTAWTSAASIAETTIDLRDPKLSITPDGRLMLLIGASTYAPGPTDKTRQRLSTRGRVCFSTDGRAWTAPTKISIENQWLWRVTWHKGIGYGIAYTIVRPMESRQIELWKTTDGINYQSVVKPAIPKDVLPNESTLRFLDDNTLLALIRNEKKPYYAQFAWSEPPYSTWEWNDLGNPAHGPNFIFLPDGKMVYAGRARMGLPPSHGGPNTMMGSLTYKSATPQLMLPSGGDNSYPGLVWHNNLLWVSYYSSHEGKASIYLAKLTRSTAPRATKAAKQ